MSDFFLHKIIKIEDENQIVLKSPIGFLILFSLLTLCTLFYLMYWAFYAGLPEIINILVNVPSVIFLIRGTQIFSGNIHIIFLLLFLSLEIYYLYHAALTVIINKNSNTIALKVVSKKKIYGLNESFFIILREKGIYPSFCLCLKRRERAKGLYRNVDSFWYKELFSLSRKDPNYQRLFKYFSACGIKVKCLKEM